MNFNSFTTNSFLLLLNAPSFTQTHFDFLISYTILPFNYPLCGLAVTTGKQQKNIIFYCNHYKFSAHSSSLS